MKFPVAKLSDFAVFRANQRKVMEQILVKCAQKLGLGSVAKTVQVHGGSINYTFRVETNTGNYLIKFNSNVDEQFFLAEQKGLNKIREFANAPRTYGVTQAQGAYCLAMEFIEGGAANPIAYDDLAYQLAALHKQHAEKWGYDEDNFMGSVPQKNKWRKSVQKFYADNRWLPLAESCADKGLLEASDVKALETLGGKLNEIIPEEKPCLVHGDLWAGNVVISGKSAFLIDPAIHYGHREADIAMTSLFDKMPADFYHSYNDYLPLEKGWESRISLFHIYPLLIHVKLFGEGYVNQLRKAYQTYL